MSKVDDWKPKLKKIDDVLVEGDLLVKQEDGSIADVHAVVGRPKRTLDGEDYYCPIQAKGFFKGVMFFLGIGPVDSLMNAMTVLRQYTHYVNGTSDELPKVLPRPTLRPWRGYRPRGRR